MNICYITNEYPKEGYAHGGLGSFLKTISEALVQKGHQVTVLGINYYQTCNEDSWNGGVRVIRLKSTKIKGLTWFFNFKKLNSMLLKLHREAPLDVVETAEMGLAFLKKIPNVKYVIRLHGGHHFFSESENRKVGLWKGYQEKRSFSKADGFIAVSEYVKNHTARYLSYGNKPIVVIKCPIDLELFKPANEQVNPYSILFVGTVCEKKGIRQLFQALPQVIDKFPRTKLIVCGRDWKLPDGTSYTNYLKKDIIPPLKIFPDSFDFKGNVDYFELPKYYSRAHVCVFPSHMETQGLVAPEAMAVQKPVIFSKLGPGPETIDHEQTGLLCDPYNPQDIAEKIIWIFENNEKVKKIELKAREAVIRNFNKEVLVERNIAFYKSVPITEKNS